MNVIVAAVVVSVAILSVARLVRCQSDRVDQKYLDPNDYFLAGSDQDRRRIQDAFNRYRLLYYIYIFNCFYYLLRLKIILFTWTQRYRFSINRIKLYFIRKRLVKQKFHCVEYTNLNLKEK